MADKEERPPAPRKASPKKPPGGNLRSRAFGEAADAFGKEIVPLGPRAGALGLRVGNLLLGMLEGAVFGLEHVSGWLQERVSKRLSDVPEDQITPPDPRIAVPAVQALVYSMNDDAIREMFASLVAASMNPQTRSAAHPAFVEMIKQMDSTDAITLKQFRRRGEHIRYRVKFVTGSTWHEVAQQYSITDVDVGSLPRAINNLERLGLIEIRETEYPLLEGFDPGDRKDHQHREMEQRFQPLFHGWSAANPLEAPAVRRLDIEKQGLYVTALGRSFLTVCNEDDANS